MAHLGLESETDLDHVGCAYWSEGSSEWKSDGLMLDTLIVDSGKMPVIECAAYHLSAFVPRGDSTSPHWNTVNLFDGKVLFTAVRMRGLHV